jgi:hypothetical protein
MNKSDNGFSLIFADNGADYRWWILLDHHCCLLIVYWLDLSPALPLEGRET